MKSKNKVILIAPIFLFLILLLSCDDDISKREWGDSKIYMPQACMLDGGLTNNYPVPLNNNPSTNNYTINKEFGLLQIVLGVYRSGKQTLKGYSVEVAPNIIETKKFIMDNDKRVMLPEDTYTLPSVVNVKDGERQAIFHLTIDLNKLTKEYPDFGTKDICLIVEISNPSKYELNEYLSKTNIIIDGSAFW
ncbi:MAG: hypothetical protein ACOX2D_05555 [Fermentimonas sp.]|jgi:hypothetical protein